MYRTSRSPTLAEPNDASTRVRNVARFPSACQTILLGPLALRRCDAAEHERRESCNDQLLSRTREAPPHIPLAALPDGESEQLVSHALKATPRPAPLRARPSSTAASTAR